MKKKARSELVQKDELDGDGDLILVRADGETTSRRRRRRRSVDQFEETKKKMVIPLMRWRRSKDGVDERNRWQRDNGGAAP
ncbi:hypothetical protein PIB30_034411, partial [Stylosanthes scabra]|nr:hypothetical protein [Stylosanthes scabra]